MQQTDHRKRTTGVRDQISPNTHTLSEKNYSDRVKCRLLIVLTSDDRPQALNWLLRSVTQPTSLHDLLWWFVAALTPVHMEQMPEGEEGEPVKQDKKDDQVRPRTFPLLRRLCPSFDKFTTFDVSVT